MKKLDNLKTVHKLIVIAGIFLAGQLVGTIFSTWGLSELSQRAEELYRVNLLPVKELGELKALNYKMVAQIGFHIQAYDSAAVAKAEKDVETVDKEIDELLAKYVPIIVSDSERKTFEQYTDNLAKFKEVREKVLKLSRLFSKDGATEVRMKKLAPVQEAMHGNLQSLIRENEQQAQANYQGSQALTVRLTTLQIVIVALMSMLGMVTAWLVATRITKNVSEVLGAAQKLAGGDLTARSRVTTTEETGQLAIAFNQMGEALAQSAAKQQDAIEEMNARIDIMNTTSIVSEADLKGDIIAVNDKYMEISKYSREELMGHPHSITRHPDMPKDTFKVMWQTIGRGEIFRGIIKNRAKDGTPYYVDAVIKPIMGPNGKPKKYLGARYDLTQHEIARQNMKGLVEAIDKSYATIEFDLTGTIHHANGLFLQTMGYSLEELKGKHHSMLVASSHRGTTEYRSFWEKLGRGEYDAGQYQRMAKGGREVWLQASYNPVMDDMGRPFKVIQFAMDITGQKQAQVEVEKLIKAATAGQLSERIETGAFSGTSRELTENVNRLLDAVASPLHEAQTVLAALAMKDLTHSMSGSYQGEFEQMKANVNGALHNLSATMTTVRAAVEAVSSGADRISKGNEDLSHRTGEQAASLEETSASMEEMTVTVKQNADNAKQADQLAITARETADKGRAVTQQAVDAMGEINKSSKKIADIITVIDEIAFQTNLLALNAAVEAARAGEHGRGFAVVSTEVRNLAQRSALAAKEIKELINESIQRVTDGSELVNQSGKTLEEIVNSVKRVTDIIAEISAASQEQASGIDQTNKAILAMDQATQQNVALVEETTSSAQSMKEQANELLSQVAEFKTRDHESAKSTGAALGGNRLRENVEPREKPITRSSAPARLSKLSQRGATASVRPVPASLAAGKGNNSNEFGEEFQDF
jgi:methyl-accepting chemotaxis protein